MGSTYLEAFVAGEVGYPRNGSDPTCSCRAYTRTRLRSARCPEAGKLRATTDADVWASHHRGSRCTCGCAGRLARRCGCGNGPGRTASYVPVEVATRARALAWAEIAGKARTDFVCPRGTQAQIVLESGGGGSTTSSNDGRRLGCASANVDRVHARWAELVHTTGLYVQRMVDPLKGLQDLMKIPWREEGFCKKCEAARMNTWGEFRRKLWNDLDVWLQLTAAEDV